MTETLELMKDLGWAGNIWEGFTVEITFQLSAGEQRGNRKRMDWGVSWVGERSRVCKGPEVVTNMGKLKEWKGGPYGLQAESPGQSGKGQQSIWRASRGQATLQSLIARLSHGTDPKIYGKYEFSAREITGLNKCTVL